MIVMKFGGTSVGSAERVRNLGERVREHLHRKPAVVVSALSGITDLLIRGARFALHRDPAAEAAVHELESRHHDAIRDLIPPGDVRNRLLAHVEAVAGELRILYTGVHYLEELTPRSLDAISAMGERLSCEIVAAALERLGLPARAFEARNILVTDDSFGRAMPLMDQTQTRVREMIAPFVDGGGVPVMGGFIGATRAGVTTTLGRGGSDWSAAILGSLLPAEEIQIWTDVDGMMTLDPRVFPGARVIAEVSFDEAAELAYFGAKVLHPATIKPAVEKGIPVRILNSLNPSAPGTLITREVRGKEGFVSKVFEVFAHHRTPVDLIATSEVSISLTVDDPATVPNVQKDLMALGEVKVLTNMAIVSVVGRGFVQRSGLAARIFHALRDVNVVMISFGASDVNVSCVVAEADAERAVKSLHQEFFGESR